MLKSNITVTITRVDVPGVVKGRGNYVRQVVLFFLAGLITISAGALGFSGQQNLNLFPRGMLLVTASETELTLTDALASDGWQSTEDETLNPSFSDDDYWFQVEISASAEELIILAETSALDYVRLWQLGSNGEILTDIVTGDRLPASKRAAPDRQFAFPLESSTGSTSIVMHFSSYDGLYNAIPLTLMTRNSYQEYQLKDSLFYGVYYGGMLVLLLYSFIVFVVARHKAFGLYSLYLSSFLFFSLSFRGYSAIFLWPESAWLANQSVPIFVICLYVSLFMFSRHMLDLPAKLPKTYKAFLIVVLSMLVPFVLALAGYFALTYKFLIPQALIFLMSLLGISIFRAIQGDRTARFFVAAFSMLLLFASFYILKMLGLIPSGFFIEHAVDIGSFAENLLFALTLADQIDRKQRENLDTQARLLRSQNELNTHLARDVSLRDREILDLRGDLHRLNRRDPETGLYNEHALFEALVGEIEVSCKLNQMLTVLHFKFDRFRLLRYQIDHDRLYALSRVTAQALSDYWSHDHSECYSDGLGSYYVVISEQTFIDIQKMGYQFSSFLKNRLTMSELSDMEHVTVSGGGIMVQCTESTLPRHLYMKADEALNDALKSGTGQFILTRSL